MKKENILDEEVTSAALVKEQLQRTRAQNTLKELEARQRWGRFLFLGFIGLIVLNIIGSFLIYEAMPIEILLMNVLLIGVFCVNWYFLKTHPLLALGALLGLSILAIIFLAALGYFPVAHYLFYLLALWFVNSVLLYDRIKMTRLQKQLEQ